MRPAIAIVALAALIAAVTPAAAATLVVASEADPDSLDPALAYAPEAWQVLVNCGEGLVAYRREAGRAGAEVVPALAAAMPSVADGGRRLVFRLRADARFGPPVDRPVRPSDVKASIERLFSAGSPGRGLYRGIRGARRFERTGAGGIPGILARDGAGEVEFRLTRSDPSFLRVLALPFAFALPRGTPPAGRGDAPAASAGPYRVAAYEPGRRIELERNRGYAPGAAGGAAGGPDRIEVRIGVGADDAARLVAEGRADYTQSRLTPAQAAAAEGSGAQVRRHVEGATYYFFMNSRRPPFDDVRVRRAVNLALDREAMAAAFAGEAVATAQVLPPGVPGHLDEPVPAADVPGARRLVRRAGAEGAEVEVWGQTVEPSPALTRRLAATLRAIGLQPAIRLWDRPALLAALADPAAPSQIGYARWSQDFPDGADWFGLLLSGSAIRAGGNLNYALLDDDRVDRLIARASATWDPGLRARRWSAVELAVRERAPWAPIANSVRTDLVSARVDGYTAHQLYGFLWMKARL
jgi:peptide/nickel transport system substrate-binding protein